MVNAPKGKHETKLEGKPEDTLDRDCAKLAGGAAEGVNGQAARVRLSERGRSREPRTAQSAWVGRCALNASLNADIKEGFRLQRAEM